MVWVLLNGTHGHIDRSRLRHLDVHFGLLLVVERSPLYSGSLRLLNIGDAP